METYGSLSFSNEFGIYFLDIVADLNIDTGTKDCCNTEIHNLFQFVEDEREWTAKDRLLSLGYR